MWICRKMEKISWTAKVNNSEVRNRVNENRCIISKINQRKRRWLGHVLRHDVIVRRSRRQGKVREAERDYSWWATYARDTKQQRNELKTDVCDVSQSWESLTCYYSRILEEEEEEGSGILVTGTIHLFTVVTVLTAGNCRQNGWSTDAPECPRSTTDAAGYRGNSGEPPADVRRAACTVQHRPRIAAHTKRHFHQTFWQEGFAQMPTHTETNSQMLRWTKKKN